MQPQKKALSRVIQLYSLFFVIALLGFLTIFTLTRDISIGQFRNPFRARIDLAPLYNNLRMWLGDRVFQKAVVGSNGWMFYTGEMSIPDYQNTAPLSQERLQQLQEALDRLNADLMQQGKSLLVVVVPNKSSVYRQYMPEQIPVLGETSRLDQILEYMRQHGQTNILDLRPALIAASQDNDVYLKADTHWNVMGAYYAYFGIIEALSRSDTRLYPHPLSDYDVVIQPDLKVPDLLMTLGLIQFKEARQALVPRFPVPVREVGAIPLSDGRQVRTTASDDVMPSLLIFHDSFYLASSSLSGLMEPHFSRLIAVPYTLVPDIWALRWIEEENPDFVVIEVAERYLDVTLPLLLGLEP